MRRISLRLSNDEYRKLESNIIEGGFKNAGEYFESALKHFTPTVPDFPFRRRVVTISLSEEMANLLEQACKGAYVNRSWAMRKIIWSGVEARGDADKSI